MKLLGCKSASGDTLHKKDTLAQVIDKSTEDFNSRPVYKKLTVGTIDSMADEQLEDPVMNNILAKMDEAMSDESEVVMRLTKPRQAIYIIWQVEAEVNNGGFNQFFYNSSAQFAGNMEEAFTTIGATKFASLASRANKIYKKEQARITKHQDGTMDGFSKSYDNNPLNHLDDEFYELYQQENLGLLKIAFIRNHKAGFAD